MDFPRWVFKSPGPLQCPGGSFDSRLCSDKEEMDGLLLLDGWSPTIPEALEKTKNQVADAIVDVSPEGLTPRKELEIKAKYWGIKVDGRWSDAKLAAMIAEVDPRSKGNVDKTSVD